MTKQQIQREFFDCDLFDSLPFWKDDMASMEHPVFSLSTQPDKRTLHYENNGDTIKIIPSSLGLPTIHDKDVLIYCLSHLRAAINQGEVPNRTVRFTIYDFFKEINRDKGGRSYELFEDSLNRLKGVVINTSIKTGRFRRFSGFGLIDAWEVVKKDSTGQVIAVEVDLSKWLYDSILANSLLTINPDYFQLRKPIERRLYEIARKHCGEQEEFKIGLAKLQLKIGSGSELREFRRAIRAIVEDNHLPDYLIALSDDDNVTFTNRLTQIAVIPQPAFIPLRPDTYEKIRVACPGCDLQELEQQWRDWAKNKEPPKRPDAAFIAFCRKKHNP